MKNDKSVTYNFKLHFVVDQNSKRTRGRWFFGWFYFFWKHSSNWRHRKSNVLLYRLQCPSDITSTKFASSFTPPKLDFYWTQYLRSWQAQFKLTRSSIPMCAESILSWNNEERKQGTNPLFHTQRKCSSGKCNCTRRLCVLPLRL